MKTLITLSNKYQLRSYSHKDREYHIYILKFGDCFYIGATNKLVRRIQAHKCCINGILIGRTIPQAKTYTKIIKHIKEASIIEFSFKVYATCYDVHTAYLAETYLLEKYILSPNCLNISTLSLIW